MIPGFECIIPVEYPTMLNGIIRIPNSEYELGIYGMSASKRKIVLHPNTKEEIVETHDAILPKIDSCTLYDMDYGSSDEEVISSFHFDDVEFI